MFGWLPEWLPVANIILGIIGFGWLIGRTLNRWREYPDELRLLLLMTLALFAGLLEVSVEIFVAENGLVRSALVICVIKVFALFTLWATRHSLYRTGTREADSGDDVNPNEDLL